MVKRMIFDTHAHYMDDRFAEDREELLASMHEAGVGNIVEVGASIQSTKDAVALSRKYDFIYGAVGVHPDGVPEMTDETIEWLKELTKEPKVVAVGEIGLDYYYDEPGRDLQKEWFIRQLEAAKETKMPVIIHSRDAAQDTLQIMEEHCDWSQGGVIHCFSYTVETAKIYLKKGFYLGIGGVVTFKNGRKLVEVVKEAPLEQLVLETDSPYLTPVPNRGKRNDSRQLTYVVDVIAQIKGIDREEVMRVTEENAKRMYRII